MDIPLYLSGNFGELRTNHFHTGLDIKTAGVVGKNIYAVADGYVSRIKISHWGYGKALYVTHPNGYTTVYAHLNKFNPAIEAFVKEVQYLKESYEIEVFPGSTQLEVKKGEIIAYSGNSGSSGGPHLHFEIRETESEHPINPLLCGFDIKDNIKPELSKIRIYPLNDTSTVNQRNAAQSFALTGSNGSYQLKSKAPIKVHGEIGVGLEVIDRLNGYGNKCGIYTIALDVDSEQVYGQRMEKLDFAVNRYMNAHLDYALHKQDKALFQKSFLTDNNRLGIYENLVNSGKLKFYDNEQHTLKYRIKDTYGNASTLSFAVTSEAKANYSKLKGNIPSYYKLLQHDTDNVLQTASMMAYFPAHSVYNDLRLQFSVGDTINRALAPMYHIHNSYTPLQHYFTLKIEVNDVPTQYHDKLLIISINEKGWWYPEGGIYKNGWISTKTRSFGDYTVVYDTIAPVITPVDISNERNMSKYNNFNLKIRDNLSGIQEYRGTIDGKWVLMTYEPKKKILTYTFDDDRLKKGKHQFKLVVTDKRGNQSIYEAAFTR